MLKPTDDEERRFILQAAAAPLSIVWRLVVNHQSLWDSLKQAIDRDEYLKYVRERKSSAKPDAPLPKATIAH